MRDRKNTLFAVPYVGWLAFFVVVPLILIVVYAFTSKSGGFTLANFSSMASYSKVFARSLGLSVTATFFCLLIGYPVAYVLSKESAGVQRIAMMLVMLPMWINFLLRTYAWMSILEDTGLLNTLFQNIGLIDLINYIGTRMSPNFEPIKFIHMINTQGAVILGMVYNYLPFMILPIYSVILKIERSTVEAAQDLGANSLMVFRKVIFPLSLPGILSGITMVFVPSVSTFALSQLLGGGKQMLLGDLIELQFTGGSYNPYLGSAISLVMMLIVMLCMALMNRFGDSENKAVMM